MIFRDTGDIRSSQVPICTENTGSVLRKMLPGKLQLICCNKKLTLDQQIFQYIYLSVCPIYLSIYLSIYVSTYLSIYLSEFSDDCQNFLQNLQMLFRVFRIFRAISVLFCEDVPKKIRQKNHIEWKFWQLSENSEGLSENSDYEKSDTIEISGNLQKILRALGKILRGVLGKFWGILRKFSGFPRNGIHPVFVRTTILAKTSFFKNKSKSRSTALFCTQATRTVLLVLYVFPWSP